MVSYVTYSRFLMSKNKNIDSSFLLLTDNNLDVSSVATRTHLLVLAIYCSIARLYCLQPIVLGIILTNLTQRYVTFEHPFSFAYLTVHFSPKMCYVFLVGLLACILCLFSTYITLELAFSNMTIAPKLTAFTAIGNFTLVSHVFKDKKRIRFT
jgi:hypothetical protein